MHQTILVIIFQVSRYLQKLEKELGKFKAELEADSEGITDVLEQMAMKEVGIISEVGFLLSSYFLTLEFERS